MVTLVTTTHGTGRQQNLNHAEPSLSEVKRQDLDATIAKKNKTFGADVGCWKAFNHYDTSPDDLPFISGSGLVAPLEGVRTWVNCPSQFCPHAQRNQHVVATS